MADPRRATFLLFAALALFGALPRAAPGQAPASSAPARAQTVTVTVTDKKGNFVKGLKAEDFGVFEGKQRLPLVSFSGEDAPASVGILLDASGSMRGERIRKVCEALAEFLSAGHPSNEYFLVAFNQMPQMLVEPSADRAAIAGALGRLAAAEQRGPTALFDAVYLGIDKAAYGSRGRRVLLVVSDGQDNTSRYEFREVRRALAESDVTLYAVSLGYDPSNALDVTGRAILEELAHMTGGRPYFAMTDKELKAALADLADELRYQYRLGFVPAPTARKDGWHEVEVKVSSLRDQQKNKLIKLVARTRPGFYDAPRPRR
jgi:Ca-activated chloride channel family protein